MGVWFWFVLAVIGFVFISIIRKWHDYAMLYTLAIGFAINANIYNATTVPMYLGTIVFSIDSILYTGFMFCVIVCAIEYGVVKAKILTSSTIAAILLSAVIEQLAKISTYGFHTEYLTSFLSYFFSVLGTFAGVWLMLWAYEKMQEKNINIYLIIMACVAIANIVNSVIFYIFTIISTGSAENLLGMLIGSVIGKIFCIMLCLLSFYMSTHFFIPRGLEEKYKPANEDEKQG